MHSSWLHRCSRRSGAWRRQPWRSLGRGDPCAALPRASTRRGSLLAPHIQAPLRRVDVRLAGVHSLSPRPCLLSPRPCPLSPRPRAPSPCISKVKYLTFLLSFRARTGTIVGQHEPKPEPTPIRFSAHSVPCPLGGQAARPQTLSARACGRVRRSGSLGRPRGRPGDSCAACSAHTSRVLAR
jgi:hypothetical protein